MQITALLAFALTTLITTSHAAGFISGAGKAAGVAAGAADVADAFSKRGTKGSAVELQWVDGGHAFNLKNLPAEVISAVNIWNSLPKLVKEGAEEAYGKLEVVGPNEVYAYGYPDSKYELRQAMGIYGKEVITEQTKV